jgi:hypothetical protein
MFGIGFLVRLLRLAVAVVIVGGILAGGITLLGFLFRSVWDVFEKNFQIQAKWMLGKLHILKPWRPFVIVFVTVLVTLCCVGFFAWALWSGQSSTGEILP